MNRVVKNLVKSLFVSVCIVILNSCSIDRIDDMDVCECVQEHASYNFNDTGVDIIRYSDVPGYTCEDDGKVLYDNGKTIITIRCE